MSRRMAQEEVPDERYTPEVSILGLQEHEPGYDQARALLDSVRAATCLRFPWGAEMWPYSIRALKLLSWFRHKPPADRIKYLQRLLGRRPWRTRKSYGAVRKQELSNSNRPGTKLSGNYRT